MKLISKKTKQQITIPDYAKQTGFTVIQIYAMIDDKKIKSVKKGKRTMILV